MAAKALFGRYWNADSPLHRLDPRTKVLGTIGFMVTVFLAKNFWSLGFLGICLGGFFTLARLPLGQALRSVLPLAFIIILTAVFNMAFVQGGTVYLDWGWLRISHEGVVSASFVALRLLLLLLAGSLLTMTTDSLDLTEAFERLLAPLGRIGVPAHEFAFVMGLALCFLPQFVDEFRSIRNAQISRGANLATSPFRNGLGALTSLVVPLFASVFRRSDTLSAAMDARCYHGPRGRTRLHPLAFKGQDATAAAILALVAVLTVLISVVG